MKLFIDTASVQDIEALAPLGIIDGVTTNPSLLAKVGGDPRVVLKQICDVVQGPVSAEVVATDSDGMVREGRELAAIVHPAQDGRHPEQNAPDRERLRPDVPRVRLNDVVWREPDRSPEVEGVGAVVQHICVDAPGTLCDQQAFGTLDQFVTNAAAPVLIVNGEASKAGTPAVPRTNNAPDQAVAVPGKQEQVGMQTEEGENRFSGICRPAVRRRVPQLQDGVDVVGCTRSVLDVAHGFRGDLIV